MSAREAEARRRRRTRAERLARDEREWVVGRPLFAQHTAFHSLPTIEEAVDAMRYEIVALGTYFASRCLVRAQARSVMVAEVRQISRWAWSGFAARDTRTGVTT